MPPFLMLIAVAFAVLMVMFGNNPLDQWREDQLKYGKDPLARQINKHNAEKAKKTGSTGGLSQYKPPQGATVYRLPPDQAQIPANNPFTIQGDNGEKLVRPAPEVPMEQWGNPYPSYMYAPPNSNAGVTPEGSGSTVRRQGGGTSIMPSRQYQ